MRDQHFYGLNLGKEGDRVAYVIGHIFQPDKKNYIILWVRKK